MPCTTSRDDEVTATQAPGAGERLHRDEEPLLVVDDLKTHFELPAGMVKAVDGVSFELARGRTLGVVGESGSGKTVLSRTVMNLNLGNNVHTSGSATFEGRELTRVRMVFGQTSAHISSFFRHSPCLAEFKTGLSLHSK